MMGWENEEKVLCQVLEEFKRSIQVSWGGKVQAEKCKKMEQNRQIMKAAL